MTVTLLHILLRCFNCVPAWQHPATQRGSLSCTAQRKAQFAGPPPPPQVPPPEDSGAKQRSQQDHREAMKAADRLLARGPRPDFSAR